MACLGCAITWPKECQRMAISVSLAMGQGIHSFKTSMRIEEEGEAVGECGMFLRIHAYKW